MVDNLTFKNSLGAEITFSHTLPFLFTDLEGLGAEPVILQTSKAFAQDGCDYYGTLSEPRLIRFRAHVGGDTKGAHDAARKQFSKVFAPKLETGMLTLRQGYDPADAYIIEAKVYDGPHDIPSKSEYVSIYEVGLHCHYPYFRSAIQYGKKLIGFEGGLTFPIAFSITFGDQGSTADINCESALPTPFTVTFTGGAENPKLEKINTGEYINWTNLLKLMYWIDTTPNNIRVLVNGEDAFNYVNANNKYFQLTPGINTLRFWQHPETRNTLQWRNAYSGI